MGDVAAYTLHNLQPGTKYDVKVVAQYTNGMSQPLAGQGTTRMYRQNPHPPCSVSLRLTGLRTGFDSSPSSPSSLVYLNVTNVETFGVEHDKFCIKWTPHRAATSYRIKLNPVDRESSAPPAAAALPSGCQAAVSLSLSWQTLIGDDVDMTHHLSAARLFIPAHMEEIKTYSRLEFGPTMKKKVSRDQLWVWLQSTGVRRSSRISLLDAPTRPSGDGWCWME